MKTSLTAAVAALSLMAGAAVAAQQPQPMPNMSTTAGRDSTGAPPMTTSAGTGVQSGTATDNATTKSATAPNAAAPMPLANGGATMTSNMPTGDAPQTYAACTKRGQDRCKSNGRRGN